MSVRSAPSAHAFAQLRLVAGFALSAALVQPCCAGPPGRDWVTPELFVAEGHSTMISWRFEPFRQGRLELVAQGFGGPQSGRLLGLAWQDSTWVTRWVLPEGIGGGLLPSFADSATQLLVWQEADGARPLDNRKYVFVATVQGDSVGGIDTVGTTNLNGRIHMGVRTRRGTWVLVSDDSTNPGTGTFDTLIRIRTKASGADSWVEIPRDSTQWAGPSNYQTAYPTSDSTVAVVLARWSYPEWGIYIGLASLDGWLQPPALVHPVPIPYSPEIRSDTDGVITLAYCNGDSLAYLSRFEGGAWSSPDTLRWDLQGGAPYDTRIVSVSEDGRRLPVVGATIYGRSLERVYISVPDENSYGLGEYIPDTEAGGSTIVQRDENGDVWAAWWRFAAGFYYMCSVPRATCAAPSIGERDGRPSITWTLTEPVLESAWVVERSADSGPFTAVGRVVAQSETTLSFVDTLAPTGAALRYRIHRPHRDVRRAWTSAVSEEWLPTASRIGLRLASTNPITTELLAEVSGARAGILDLQLLDLQGRVVHRMRQPASGLGRDRFRIALADMPQLRAGLYLLRVRPQGASASRSIKVAIVR